MVIETLALTLLMVLLGTAYIKGYDLVKAKSPDHLPHFYLIMTTLRILLILTVIGTYALLADERGNAIRFAITGIILYVIMMAVTLSLRH